MSKNAAGKVWFDFFINSLNIDLAEKLKHPNESTFKFGGGRILAFLKKILSVFNEKDDEFWISLKNIQIVDLYENVLNQLNPNLLLATFLTQIRWKLTNLWVLA